MTENIKTKKASSLKKYFPMDLLLEILTTIFNTNNIEDAKKIYFNTNTLRDSNAVQKYFDAGFHQKLRNTVRTADCRKLLSNTLTEKEFITILRVILRKHGYTLKSTYDHGSSDTTTIYHII